jgi:hypothetical protein
MLSTRIRAASGPLAISLAMASCALRVGSGKHPPDESTDTVTLPSACAHVGAETKLPFGKGAEAFALAWDGQNYVIAYADPSTGNGDIYVAKVAADGSAVGSPVIVESTPAQSDLPTLVRVQTGYVVVWQEGSAGKAVYAHRLDAGGAPTGTGATIAAVQSDQPRPVVAQAPAGQVAVAWMDNFEGKPGVEAALVDPSSLHVGPSTRIAASDADGWPWVAGDTDLLGIAWSDKASGPYDVKFTHLDAQLGSAAVPTFLRGAREGEGDCLLPRLRRTTFGFMAAWEDTGTGDENQIYMALMGPGGVRFAGGLVEEPDSGDANWPNIAWTGAAAGIVYYQWRTGRPQIFISFVDGKGARVAGLHDLQVSAGSGGWSKFPDVVWTGHEFGVVYVDTRDGPSGLWLQRVSCQG